MGKKIGLIGVLALLVLGIIALFMSAYVVRPDQFAIVTQFGEAVRIIQDTRCAWTSGDNPCPEGQVPDADGVCGECQETDAIPAPGLYFKIPFVQEVQYLDARVRGWDDEGLGTKTKELRTIDFTAFARWRIADPLRYYNSTNRGEEKRAMAGMDSIITAQIQTAIREQKLASIVRDRGRRFEKRAELQLEELIAGYEECQPGECRNPELPGCKNRAVWDILEDARLATEREEAAETQDAKALRSEIVESIRKMANERLLEKFGIKVFDLHFKYLNYSPQVWKEMIDAIRADRERDIASYRKVGKACRGSIDQVKERRKGEILGDRDRQVRELGGEATAEAIRVKALAFNKDPQFFRFIKTLELYGKAMNPGTRLVLSGDNPLLKLMSDPALMAAVKTRVIEDDEPEAKKPGEDKGDAEKGDEPKKEVPEDGAKAEEPRPEPPTPDEVEAKKEEKAEPKKDEPEKAEPKKDEPKKDEPKKGESKKGDSE